MRIHLIRHGEPSCPPKVSLSRHEYRCWIDDYNAAGIVDAPRDLLRRWFLASGARSVFASTMPRSIQSAKALAEGADVRTFTLFNEAAVAVAPIPLRLNSSSWTTLGRIMWLLGSPADEDIAACQIRAVSAADALMESAAQAETVLVGHGWFNRMIGNQLLKRGFERSEVTGRGYWCRASFEKSTSGS